jgi:hypothetical protein
VSSTGGSNPREFRWVIIGTVAAVIGALAAAAVFFIPVPGPRGGDDPTTSATDSEPAARKTFSTTDSAGPSTGGPSTAGANNERVLTALSPEIGSGSIQVTGQDIAIPCPSNQSDDTEREFGYALPSAFGRLTARVTLTGDADPDSTASVQVFIMHRQDRSDRVPEVGRVVVTSGGAGDLKAELASAVALRLRIRCASSEQTVHLIDPRISR